MVASFMPSIAFAGTGAWTEYGTKVADAWKWTPGEKTATLVKIEKDGEVRDVNYPATVSYAGWECGKTKKVTVTFTTKDNIEGAAPITKAYTEVEVTFPAHDYEDVAAVAPICGTNGKKAAKKCKNCGDVIGGETVAYTEAKLPDEHHYILDKADKHWEVQAGGNSVKLLAGAALKCDDCGSTFTLKADTAVANIQNSQVIKPATCSTEGLKGSVAVVTAAKENLLDSKNAVPEKDVKVSYVKSSEKVDTTAHTFNSTNVKFVWDDKTPACVAKIGGCTVCGYNATEIPCTVTATAGTTNTNCAEDRNVTYTATCKDSAGKNYEPTNPSEATKVYTVAAGEHSFVYHDAVAATCDKAGNKEYYQCSSCKKYGNVDANGKVVADASTEATYAVAAQHEFTGTYTWPTAQALEDAIKNNAVVTQFKAQGTIYTVDQPLGSLNVTVSDLKCNGCGLAYNATETKILPIYVDVDKFYEANLGKSCTDDIVVPLVAKTTDQAGIEANTKYQNASVIAAHKANKYVVIGTEKVDSATASGHAVSNVAKFEWDTTDSENIKCDVVLQVCNNKTFVYDATTKTYKFDAEKKCDHVITSQPATVEGKVTVEPTCTKNGEGEFVATYKYPVTNKVITEKKTLVLAKAAHKTEVIPAVAATVFTTGSKDGVKCSVCGEILTQPKEVAKLKVGTAKISSLKAGKKSFTVKASAVNATGYRVYYKKAGAKKYSYTTVKAKNLSKTVKKLSAGKKYTVKVKAYAKNYDGDGEVVWGALSSGKTVKVK